jgi:hypothetical protein
LLKKLKIEFTNSWKKDKLVELLCEGDLKKALNKMTTEQLKIVLDDMNLSQSGKKSILIDRILEGEADGGNNSNLPDAEAAQAALQEFKDLINSPKIYNLMIYEEIVGDFEGIDYESYASSGDPYGKHCQMITAIILHRKSNTYIEYSLEENRPSDGSLFFNYDPRILEFKREETIETTTEKTYIRFQCGQSVKVSEKITSRREIK